VAIPLRPTRDGPELRFEDPCIVFALRQERRPFTREFRINQSFPEAPCWAKFCGPAWLSCLAVESGVGRRRAESAANWLLSGPRLENVGYRPRLVVAAGFCGGLEENLRTGDLILATEVMDAATGRSYPATWPPQLPLGPWQPPLKRGRMVTVVELAAQPRQKRSLAAEYGAAAVDMESGAIAACCQEAGVPYCCLRAVVDEAATPLSPRLVSLLSASRISPWRLGMGLARAPGLMGELLHLARRSQLAGARLAAGLGELLTLTLPWLQA
jgi:adenosylhomocysteine nucleosidase